MRRAADIGAAAIALVLLATSRSALDVLAIVFSLVLMERTVQTLARLIRREWP